ncbi:MAG: hypothetical protein ACR2QY_07495 [Akkermansiaceae bacterium]
MFFKSDPRLSGAHGYEELVFGKYDERGFLSQLSVSLLALPLLHPTIAE